MSPHLQVKSKPGTVCELGTRLKDTSRIHLRQCDWAIVTLIQYQKSAGKEVTQVTSICINSVWSFITLAIGTMFSSLKNIGFHVVGIISFIKAKTN